MSVDLHPDALTLVDPLVQLQQLVTGYGSLQVLHGVDIAVPQGEIAVILGANGVGKTTTIRAISGALPTWSGTLSLEGKTLGRLRAEDRVRLGIGTVPAASAVFRDLSVLDNLRVGAIALRRAKGAVERQVHDVLDVFPALKDRTQQLAGSLSGGEQRMVAIARALMGSPRLLLVDEASMGLSPRMVMVVMELLHSLRGTGLTICMVEQNVAALDVADRAYLMEKGRVVHAAGGRDVQLIRDEAARVYLGTAGAHKADGR
jgi:branched-chain amino acid transport system ATP-binding protein